MSIRPGVFRVGETVEITGVITNTLGEPATNASGVKLTLRRPQTDSVLEFTLVPVGGVVGMDIEPNEIGTWKVRLECEDPTPTVREGKFEVVDSIVSPVLPYTFY